MPTTLSKSEDLVSTKNLDEKPDLETPWEKTA